MRGATGLMVCIALTAPGLAQAQASEPETAAEELNTSSEQVAKATDRDVVIMPIPVSNPSIGSGLALTAMAIYRPGGRAAPWTTGAGAMYADSQSWAVGVFQKANLADDRFRLTASAGTGDFHLDFYGIGSEAGSRDVSVAIEQETDFAGGRALMRVADHAYVGPMVRFVGVNTSLDLSDLDLLDELELPPLELESRIVGLGVAGEYDSRDSEYGPTRGVYAEGHFLHADEGFGSDFDYGKLQASLNIYHPLAVRTVVAGRISICDVGDGAPFYDLCSFGQNADLRGYASGRYRDHALAAVQIELRHRFGRRFGAVVFAGVGGVAPSFGALGDSDLLPAAGLGLRYSASKSYGVNVAVDYAVGRDSHGLYFRIGEAF